MGLFLFKYVYLPYSGLVIHLTLLPVHDQSKSIAQIY